MSQLLLKNGAEVILPSIVGQEYVNHWKDESFTNEQHHGSLEATSSSSLKLITESPYTYLASLKDRQNGKDSKESKAMKFGSLCHLAILEPEKFRKKIVMSPKFDLRTKIGKEDKELFMLELSPGAVVLNPDEYENLMGVISAVVEHPKARSIFSSGICERSGFYRDPITGILCRVRPDFIADTMFIDLKTTRASDYREFSAQAWQYRYDLQLAMYREAIKQIDGKYPEISGWVTVMNASPFEVSVYTASEQVLSIGEKWYRYCLDRLKKCIDEKNFPQRQQVVEDMCLPKYAEDEEIPSMEN